jgi:hypothetical protein
MQDLASEGNINELNLTLEWAFMILNPDKAWNLLECMHNKEIFGCMEPIYGRSL